MHTTERVWISVLIFLPNQVNKSLMVVFLHGEDSCKMPLKASQTLARPKESHLVVTYSGTRLIWWSALIVLHNPGLSTALAKVMIQNVNCSQDKLKYTKKLLNTRPASIRPHHIIEKQKDHYINYWTSTTKTSMLFGPKRAILHGRLPELTDWPQTEGNVDYSMYRLRNQSLALESGLPRQLGTEQHIHEHQKTPLQ